MIRGIETEKGWRLSSPDPDELRLFHGAISDKLCDPLPIEFHGGEWQILTETDPIKRSPRSWTWYSVSGDDPEMALDSLKAIAAHRPVGMKPLFGKNFAVACEACGSDGRLARGILFQYSSRGFGRK